MILMILSIYGLSFILRNTSGPFDVFSFIRNKVLNNKHIGVFSFQLLNCPWCFGWHCGYLIYLLSCLTSPFSFGLLVVWSCAGSAIVGLGDAVYERLTR